ncbi:uncharacterized protein C21orf58 homolog [Bombina bombina]|uniref:uncharacterized protein C21orf58 homolog n=1 Tax=Bombina bombina TaxID=8345 RepID=UPI00235AF856|nr:uncharacterized protein C21orf58 homolog [Bombina bombina]
MAEAAGIPEYSQLDDDFNTDPLAFTDEDADRILIPEDLSELGVIEEVTRLGAKIKAELDTIKEQSIHILTNDTSQEWVTKLDGLVNKYRTDLINFKNKKLNNVENDYRERRVYRWLYGKEDGTYRRRRNLRSRNTLSIVDSSGGDSSGTEVSTSNDHTPAQINQSEHFLGVSTRSTAKPPPMPQDKRGQKNVKPGGGGGGHKSKSKTDSQEIDVIFNLSSRPLSNAERSLLNHGLSFIPTPKSDKFEQLVDIHRFQRQLKLKDYFREQTPQSEGFKKKSTSQKSWLVEAEGQKGHLISRLCSILLGSYDGQEDALQSALRRRKELMYKLREQHLMEELTRPHTWEGTRKKTIHLEPIHQAPPMHFYPPPPPPEPPVHFYRPPPPPEPPRIIQQQIPQQPTTIIQQLPSQQPLITQIPPPQTLPPIRSGSIKEDMVEMMLMQNAQMHQIIMQNMMLKALPPMALSQPASGGPSAYAPNHQEPAFTSPVVRIPEKMRPSSVHHHHHYTPPGLPSAPPTMQPAPVYSMWPQMMPQNPTAHMNGFPQTVHHMTGPTTMLPSMHT